MQFNDLIAMAIQLNGNTSFDLLLTNIQWCELRQHLLNTFFFFFFSWLRTLCKDFLQTTWCVCAKGAENYAISIDLVLHKWHIDPECYSTVDRLLLSVPFFLNYCKKLTVQTLPVKLGTSEHNIRFSHSIYFYECWMMF